MTNNIITIDPQRVKNAGREIVDQGTIMYNALKDIQDIVNSTSKCLKSDGGDEARANFNSSAAMFDEFKKFIHEYGHFLQNYGEGHQKLDNEVKDIASKIPKFNN